MEIKRIILLRERGDSIREIALSENLSKTTVSDLLKKCNQQGITSDQISEENYGDLLALLYPRERKYEALKAEPDWEEVHKKITTRKRVNLKYLWEEYKEEHPDGYKYSQFCNLYQKWRGVNKDVTMVQEHTPGKRACVDWAGLAPDLVKVNGKGTKAYFFVGVLDYSYYPFIHAYPNQKQANWTRAHIKMFSWFGGVPEIVTPDNCKTAVIHSSIWDPEINQAYRDLGDHYGIAILPARVRKPRDKSSAEGTVGFLETWIIEKLTDIVGKNGLFDSFDELNLEAEILLEKLITDNFQKRPGSRKSVFEEVEKETLLPLPKEPFDTLSYLKWTVNKTYHYHHRESDSYYSVPYTQFAREVSVRAGLRTLSVFDKDGILIAKHMINQDKNKRYITISEHMPPHHKVTKEFNDTGGKEYVLRARMVGKSTELFIDTLLKSVKHEQTMFRSCQAIFRLVKNVGKDRVEMACERLLGLGSISFNSLKSMLDKNLEAVYQILESQPTPSHENLRDPSIYV